MNEFVLGNNLLYDQDFVSLGVRTQLSYIYLMSICDQNGVCFFVSSFLEDKLMLNRSLLPKKLNDPLGAEKRALKKLQNSGYICEFWDDNKLYFWLPRFSPSQPRKGSLKPKKKGYPVPPKNIVEHFL